MEHYKLQGDVFLSLTLP